MSLFSEPSASNAYQADHISHLLRSYRERTGKELVEAEGATSEEIAKAVFEAPFFLASHGVEGDPVLNYGNLSALDLFAMSWEQFTQTPSRFTAETPNQAERQQLLERVSANGFIDDYSGVRISAEGKRFRIYRATVWDVTDLAGEKTGQAAVFSEWQFL